MTDDDEKTLHLDLTEQDGDWMDQERREQSSLDDLASTDDELAELKAEAAKVKEEINRKREDEE